MSFVAPLMLAAIAAAAYPIWLHLYGARRAKRVPFSAVEFLFGNDRKVSRHIRLRRLLQVLARVAVFVVIPLLMAKPLVTCQSSGPTVFRGPQAAVLVIDDGIASSFVADGSSLIEVAKSKALTLLDRVGPDAELAIITTSGALEHASLSREHLRIRDEIRDLAATPRRTDTSAALARAEKLLQHSSHSRTRIFLFATLTASSFADVSSGQPSAAVSAPLAIIDTTEGRALDNVAITDIRASANPESGHRGITVAVTVANFGVDGSAMRTVRLEMNGSLVATSEITVDAGESETTEFNAALEEGRIGAEIEAYIEPDALEIDDRRFAVARLNDVVDVLLVNGDPRTTRHTDELFYVRTALSRHQGTTSVGAVTADRLPDTDLKNYDVVILANVPPPEHEQIQKLEKFASSGGGIFIAVGDNTNAAEYNLKFARLLPRSFANVFDATYSSRRGSESITALRMEKFESRHAIFSAFGDKTETLSDALFDRVMLLGPDTSGESRSVLARYQNGAAALVERNFGRGRILLFTSTLDRDWTDFPIHTGYLPFLDQSVRYLARKDRSNDESPPFIGDSKKLQIEARDQRIEVRKPDGKAIILEGDKLKDRKRVRVSDTALPGFYEVAAIDVAGARNSRPDHTFAINVDPKLSDLARVVPSRIPKSVARPSSKNDTEQHRSIELWHGLGAALLILLLCEGILTGRS